MPFASPKSRTKLQWSPTVTAWEVCVLVPRRCQCTLEVARAQRQKSITIAPAAGIAVGTLPPMPTIMIPTRPNHSIFDNISNV